MGKRFCRRRDREIRRLVDKLSERVDGATEISGCLRIKTEPVITPGKIEIRLEYNFRDLATAAIYIRDGEKEIKAELEKLRLQEVSNEQLILAYRGYSAIISFLGENSRGARVGEGDILRIYELKV